jgi:hypothetical protein
LLPKDHIITVVAGADTTAAVRFFGADGAAILPIFRASVSVDVNHPMLGPWLMLNALSVDAHGSPHMKMSLISFRFAIFSL